MKGLLITFEGGEGAGKTTLIEGVFRYLSSQGHHVIRTREPGGTQIGEEVRSIVLQHRDGGLSPFAELSLFLASRAQQVEEVIIPGLKKGKIVLCDRFNDSSIVYQGMVRGLGKEGVAQVCSFFSQGLVPDATFYLDLDPSIGFSRVQKTRVQDRIEQEGLPFHAKVRASYLALAQENRNRIQTLDATLPKEKVLSQTLEKICSLIS